MSFVDEFGCHPRAREDSPTEPVVPAPVDEATGVAAVGLDEADVAVQTAQPGEQARRGVPVADVLGGDRDDQEQAEAVGHDVPLAGRGGVR